MFTLSIKLFFFCSFSLSFQNMSFLKLFFYVIDFHIKYCYRIIINNESFFLVLIIIDFHLLISLLDRIWLRQSFTDFKFLFQKNFRWRHEKIFSCHLYVEKRDYKKTYLN
jgi:hypothetical protein